MDLLDATRLRELLDYDRETGIFTWRQDRSSGRKGRVAGCAGARGIIIVISGVQYSANRLAWLHVTGEWPADLIDHRDLDNSNNRWTNLREATYSQNRANIRPYRNNKSGCKGVHWYKSLGKWVARVGKDGKRKHLGYFEVFEDAVSAYATAARREHGEFVRV